MLQITNLISENHVSEIMLIEGAQNANEQWVGPMSKVFPKVSPIEKSCYYKSFSENHVTEITLIEGAQNKIEQWVDPMFKVFPKVSPIEKSCYYKSC